MTFMQCTICRLDEEELNLVGEKGLKTLLMAASEKKETEARHYTFIMIVGGSLLTFQRSLLDLNPKG